ncbi:MAG: hypothetical protein SGJ27_00115 [Candidatus Melainabacteria bacterium]|nr:hypothetical protein [Candidatus Melainabacteria bacterium]
MWPKRKKSKARATKLKLKALQPNQENQPEGQDFEPDGEAPQVELPPDPRSQQNDQASGVWKSKVLTNYKQNPRDSHNLLARIPTGKAAFQAGERQKTELIKEAMIRIVDRMFDNFQNTAYEFNQVTAGTDLELTWIRPLIVQEEVSNWHDSSRVQIEIFSGRISTRYWTLAVRGTATGVDTYILPSDKLLGFSTNPNDYPSYLSLVSQSDGLSVDWIVANTNKPLDSDMLPSVYRALLDGLIRFASEEAQPGETFRLEDIGMVPEAPAPVAESVGYQGGSQQHDLLGQSSARNPVVASPSISSVNRGGSSSSSADRFIDNISNQVAQAAQNETDKFRESLQAPPFGTSNRAPGDPGQSGVMSANPPREPMQSPAAQPLPPVVQQQPPAVQPQPAGIQQQNAGRQANQNDGWNEAGPADEEAPWKSVAADEAVKTDWRKFMENTKESLKSAPSAPAKDDNWNALPGTEQLARPSARGLSQSQQMSADQQQAISNSQVMQGQPYPSYGSASDPPVLLKPQDYGQSGNYSSQGIGSSGLHSAQQMQPQMQAEMQSQMQPQMQPHIQPQSQQQPQQLPPHQPQPGYAGLPGMSQSGAYSTQQSINQSGSFPGAAPQMPPHLPPHLPPQMMPPGFSQPMPMPQPLPPMMQPGINNPGLPSMPGMILPGMSQSGVHQQPITAEQYHAMQQAALLKQQQALVAPVIPPGGMQGINPPQGMIQLSPPQGMSAAAPMAPHMMPGHKAENSGHYPNQASMAAMPQQFAEQQRQYNTGGQPALPPQFEATRPPVVPPQTNPQQYNTGSQQQLPPQYNAGAQQSPGQYSTDAHQQLQYAQGGYSGTAHPLQAQQIAPTAPPPEDTSYLLSEHDYSEQEQQYPSESEQYPEHEQGEDEGWQTEEGSYEEVAVELEVEVGEAQWEETGNSAFAQSSFPQESCNELPVVSPDTMQKFQEAQSAGFVFSSENDLVDAISVVLDTIDSQIERLANQGTDAFRLRDFRRAESIIKLSERLTSFKAESQAILHLMSQLEE